MTETITMLTPSGSWSVVKPEVEATPTVTSPSKPARVKKEPKQAVACWCGCGGPTMGRFVPGHDAKFHGRAKLHARGIVAGENPTLPEFVHDEAREDFMKWVNSSLPKYRAEADAKAAIELAREEAKAAKVS